MKQRIKDICDYVSRGSAPKYVDMSPYKVMNQATFSKGYLNCDNLRYTKNASVNAQIKKGDLLMASTGGGVLGKVFFYNSEDENFYADSHVTILRCTKGNNLMKFLYYYFSIKYDEINAILTKGSTNQTELQKSYLLAYELLIPPITQQKRIVTYLDKKTSEIDDQITHFEQLKDAYIRLKASVIHTAVTRGLNPKVELKDSGIEWIGMIPKHWNVVEIKYYCNSIYAGATPSTKIASYWDGDIPWIPSGACHDSIISTYKDSITQEGYLHSSTKIIPDNTTLMAMTGATCANTGYLTFPSCANQSVCAYVEDENICSAKYLYYMLQAARSYILTFKKGGAQAGINIQDCSLLKVPKVGKDEQQAIAEYLDKKCSAIEGKIKNIDKQIDAYKRLRNALINEVITGQRTV